jgi:hypothetical protein
MAIGTKRIILSGGFRHVCLEKLGSYDYQERYFRKYQPESQGLQNASIIWFYSAVHFY